jgi:hypothetical protein
MTAKPTRDPPEALSLRAHRRIVGTIGFFLPALVYGFAAARPTAGLDRWQLLWSVSAYYYTGAVGVLVGALFALALFLFSYRGYKGVIADRIVGGVGGPGGADRGAVSDLRARRSVPSRPGGAIRRPSFTTSPRWCCSSRSSCLRSGCSAGRTFRGGATARPTSAFATTFAWDAGWS